MSTRLYNTLNDSGTEPPHLLSPRDLDVLTSRDISLDLAVQSGLRTRTGHEMTEFGFRGDHARDGLHIPLFNTQGIISGDQLRPGDPPIKETVRPDGEVKRSTLKYLLCSGARMQIYVPPVSQPFLDNPDIPLVIAESPLKALAILSNAEPGSVCVIAIIGVWGWRTKAKHGNGYKKMPLPEHKNGISWGEVDRDGRIRKRRLVYVVFDSDVHTNIMVSRARWEYTEYLRDLGADVRWIDLSPTPEGDKQGVDDALAAGSPWAGMVEGAYRAPEVAPELAYAAPNGEQETEVERLRRENEQLRNKAARQSRHISALTQLFRDKRIAATDKAVAVSTLAEAHAKRSRGEVEPDGRIRLEDRHIANDHRAITPKGVPRPETNNDGTYPITDRKRVKTILGNLKAVGAVSFETDKVIKTHKATGDRYKVEEVIITISDDISVDLMRLTEHTATKKTRERYTRQEPCQSCGEVHDRTRRTYCDGCGSEYEKPKHLPVQEFRVVNDDYTEPDAPPESASEKNGKASVSVAALGSAPITYLSEKNGEPQGRPPIHEEIAERQRSADSPQQAAMTDIDRDLARYGFSEQWGD